MVDSRYNNVKQALKWGIVLTLFLRIGLGLIMAGTWLKVKPYLLPVINTAPSPYGRLAVPMQPPWDTLLAVWVRWDASHHLNLAMNGYFDLSVASSVFYPLFATITRLFTNMLGLDYVISGLSISTIFTIISFMLLYMLAKATFDEQTAKWSVLVLAVYPTSFFLLAPFTESLFLALTLAAFWAAETKRWGLTGIFGFLASLTRGPGILTPIALAALAWRQWKDNKYHIISKPMLFTMLGLTLPILGGLAFLFWRKYSGFPPVSVVLEEYFGLVVTNPISGLINAIIQWIGVRDITTTLELFTAVLFIFLSVSMIKKIFWNKPEWCIYTVINLAIFFSKQSYVHSSLQSISRYVLVLFPIYIFLGHWIAQQGYRTRLIYISISSIGLSVLTVYYTLWIFVG